jgi:hypothetical protein
MADAPDSKSGPRKRVWVQVPPSVLANCVGSALFATRHIARIAENIGRRAAALSGERHGVRSASRHSRNGPPLVCEAMVFH